MLNSITVAVAISTPTALNARKSIRSESIWRPVLWSVPWSSQKRPVAEGTSRWLSSTTPPSPFVVVLPVTDELLLLQATSMRPARRIPMIRDAMLAPFPSRAWTQDFRLLLPPPPPSDLEELHPVERLAERDRGVVARRVERRADIGPIGEPLEELHGQPAVLGRLFEPQRHVLVDQLDRAPAPPLDTDDVPVVELRLHRVASDAKAETCLIAPLAEDHCDVALQDLGGDVGRLPGRGARLEDRDRAVLRRLTAEHLGCLARGNRLQHDLARPFGPTHRPFASYQPVDADVRSARDPIEDRQLGHVAMLIPTQLGDRYPRGLRHIQLASITSRLHDARAYLMAR